MAADLTVIGKYELLDRLGKGGMGAVYLARDPVLDRLVAIKVLAGAFDNEYLRSRFSQEARAISRLRHPNIVTIFEHDLGSRPFIAMEYVRGESWAELIGRRAQLLVPRKLQMMEELCAGMAYAHRCKIVHRDLKPANIMVDEEAGSIKILDFGIARNLESTATSTLVVGTPRYMSPEQTTGKGVDHRSDVFAVGTVFYELLSYTHAFEGEVEAELIEKVRHCNPRPLSDVCVGLDPKLVEIVDMAMAKQPAARYQDLEVMRAAIQAVREHSLGRTTPRKHRPGQVKLLVAAAQQALAESDYDSTLDYCEQILSLDGAQAAALEMMEKARLAIEERTIETSVLEARSLFDQHAITAAEELITQALKLRATFPPAVALQRELQQARRERARVRERAVLVQAVLARARANLAEGALESALRAATEALAYDPAHAEAQSLKNQAATALAERLQRDKQEEIDRRVMGIVEQARQQFIEGHQAEALERLSTFSPPHSLATSALGELRQEWNTVVLKRIEQDQRERQERARQERQRLIERLLARASDHIDAAEFDGAAISLGELEALDAAIPERQALLRKLEAGRLAAEELLTRRRHEEAEREREAVYQREQEQWFDDRLRSARVALDGGRHEAAVDILNEVRRRDPRAPGLVEIQAAADSARAQQIALERETEASRRLHALAKARESIDAQLSTGRLDEAEQAIDEAERSFGTAELHVVRQRLSSARSLQKQSIASPVGVMEPAPPLGPVRADERLARRYRVLSRYNLSVMISIAAGVLILVTAYNLNGDDDLQPTSAVQPPLQSSELPVDPNVRIPPTKAGGGSATVGTESGARGGGGTTGASGTKDNSMGSTGSTTGGTGRSPGVSPSEDRGASQPVLPPATGPSEGTVSGGGISSGGSLAAPLPEPSSPSAPESAPVPSPTRGSIAPELGPAAAPPAGAPVRPATDGGTGGAEIGAGVRTEPARKTELEAISATGEQYRVAYGSKNIDLVQQVHPKATVENTFANWHNDCRELSLKFVNAQPDLLSDGKGQLRTTSEYTCTPRKTNQRPQRFGPYITIFELEKIGSRWLIVRRLTPTDK